MERVSIFIDGSNFYYSTAKKGKKIKFKKLIEELVRGRELIDVFYYVAPLDYKTNPKKYWKHQKFLDKLKTIPKFNVVLCTLKKIKIDGKCLYFVKGDDVKLSNNLLMGAVDNLYDIAIVVSGDEDFVDSIKIVRERYKKKVGNAYFKSSSSPALRKICNFLVPLDKLIIKIIEKNDVPALPEDHTGEDSEN